MKQLVIKNAKKAYGKNRVLHNVSFELHSGEILGLLGKNGAGKTTLMNMICGTTSIDDGSIGYRDLEIRKHPEILRHFGVLINPVFLNYLTVEDNLMVLGLYSGINKKRLIKEIPQLLETVGLKGKEREFPEQLSFGQRQKLGVAQALMGEKEILILDEPFVGQDYSGVENLVRLLTEKVKTNKISVLISSHNFEILYKICHRCVVLKEGVVSYDGGFKEQAQYYIEYKQHISEKDRKWLGEQEDINLIGGTKIQVRTKGKLLQLLNTLKNYELLRITEPEEILKEFFIRQIG